MNPYDVVYVYPRALAFCSSHRVPRSYTPAGTFVAAFHFTVALLPTGPAPITQPSVWYNPEAVKTEKELDDAELKELISTPLREDKKNTGMMGG